MVWGGGRVRAVVFYLCAWWDEFSWKKRHNGAAITYSVHYRKVIWAGWGYSTGYKLDALSRVRIAAGYERRAPEAERGFCETLRTTDRYVL